MQDDWDQYDRQTPPPPPPPPPPFVPFGMHPLDRPARRPRWTVWLIIALIVSPLAIAVMFLLPGTQKRDAVPLERKVVLASEDYEAVLRRHTLEAVKGESVDVAEVLTANQKLAARYRELAESSWGDDAACLRTMADLAEMNRENIRAGAEADARLQQAIDAVDTGLSSVEQIDQHITALSETISTYSEYVEYLRQLEDRARGLLEKHGVSSGNRRDALRVVVDQANITDWMKLAWLSLDQASTVKQTMEFLRKTHGRWWIDDSTGHYVFHAQQDSDEFNALIENSQKIGREAERALRRAVK